MTAHLLHYNILRFSKHIYQGLWASRAIFGHVQPLYIYLHLAWHWRRQPQKKCLEFMAAPTGKYKPYLLRYNENLSQIWCL